jgi:hypothetical protein
VLVDGTYIDAQTLTVGGSPVAGGRSVSAPTDADHGEEPSGGRRVAAARRVAACWNRPNRARDLNLPQVPVSLQASLFLIVKFPVPICRELRPDASGFGAFSRTRSGI